MRTSTIWAIISIAIAVVAILISVRFTYDTRIDRDNKSSKWAVEFDPSISRLFREDATYGETSEDAASNAEHLNIISSIINCLKLRDYTDYYSLPSSLKNQFVLPQRFQRKNYLEPNLANAADENIRIPGYFRSITGLSSLISDRRGQLASSMKSSRLLMQELQIASIVIGIITTILVGIKSGAKSPRAYDVAAIVSAAVGTGVASLIAFYNPREEYIRTARAISQFSQLQTQMSFALGSENACSMTDQNNKNLLIDWYGNFASISAASEDFGETRQKQKND